MYDVRYNYYALAISIVKSYSVEKSLRYMGLNLKEYDAKMKHIRDKENAYGKLH